MSKVLVDRDLLLQLFRCWDCGLEVDNELAQLRIAAAQPAEAEGVVIKIECTTCRGTGSLEFEGGAVVKDCAPCKGTGRDLKAERYALAARLAETSAALSSVTAERDRLREEMAELWKRIDKFQSQTHGISALAEIERLRAESEALRADAERFRWLAHQGDACQWMNIIRVDPDDFESYAEAVDAAMAAKEA